MNAFSDSLIIESLGWMLVHSLWLLLVPALGFAAILQWIPVSASKPRYAAGLATLLLMASLPLAALLWIDHTNPAPRVSRDVPGPSTADSAVDSISLPIQSEQSLSTERSDAPEMLPVPDADTTASLQKDSSEISMREAERLPSPPPGLLANPAQKALPEGTDHGTTPIGPAVSYRLRPWLPWFVTAWFCGTLLMAFRLLAGWKMTRRLKTTGQSRVPDSVGQLFEELRSSLGATLVARVAQSTLVQIPSVVGHFRPIVLLPVSALTGLEPAQLRAILAHELAHVRRYDYAVNVLQTAIETVLFYHPAVWWVSRVVRVERECCCDDIALSAHCKPVELARALMAVDAVRLADPQRSMGDGLAAAADGGNLLRRIRRLSGEPVHRLASQRSWFAGVMVLTLLAAVATASMLPDDGEQKASENRAGEHPPANPPADQSCRVQFDDGYFIELAAITDLAPRTGDAKPNTESETDNIAHPNAWTPLGTATEEPFRGVPSEFEIGDQSIARMFFVRADLPEGSVLELHVDGRTSNTQTTSSRPDRPFNIQASALALLPKQQRTVDVVVDLKLPAWQTLATFDFAGGVHNGIRLDWERKISPETKYTASGDFRGAEAEDLRIVAFNQDHHRIKASGFWHGGEPLEIGAHFSNKNGRPSFISIQRRLPTRSIVFRNVPLQRKDPLTEVSERKSFFTEIDGSRSSKWLEDASAKDSRSASLTSLLTEPHRPLQATIPDMGTVTLLGLRKQGSKSRGWSADGTERLLALPKSLWSQQRSSNNVEKRQLEAVFEVVPEVGVQVTGVRIRPNSAQSTTALKEFPASADETPPFVQLNSLLQIGGDRETDDVTVHVSTNEWQPPTTVDVSPTPKDFEFGKAAYYNPKDRSQTVAFRTDNPEESENERPLQHFVVFRKAAVLGNARVSAITSEGKTLEGTLNSFSSRRMFLHFEAEPDVTIKSLVLQSPVTHKVTFRNVSMWKHLGTLPLVEMEPSFDSHVNSEAQPSRVFRRPDGTLLAENGDAAVINAVEEIQRRGGLLRFDSEATSPSGMQLPYLTEIRWEGFPAEQIRWIEWLSGLHRVNLASDQLTDQSLKSLEHLQSLQRLSLAHTSKLTTAGLQSIGKLTSLRDLSLPGTLSVGDEAYDSNDFQHLAGLKQLREYEPMNWRLDDAGLQCLRDAKQLEMVYTFGPEVTDAGFAALANKPNLGVIHLHQTKITDASFRLLEDHPRLYWLQCSSPNLTDEAIDSVITLSGLRDLHLYGSKVTNAGVRRLIASLDSLPKLELVNLSNTQVSQEAAEQLRAARKGLRVLCGVDQTSASGSDAEDGTTAVVSESESANGAVAAEPANETMATVPANVPWPVEQFESFAKYPPSGSGVRVKIDDRRWIELNSISNSGTKIDDRDLKVFWTPDGTLIDPPKDFDPLSLVPDSKNGRMPDVAREAALQIVAPEEAYFTLKSGGGGGYGRFSVPVGDDFVQFPIQHVITGLGSNHTYIEARVTDGTWEELSIANAEHSNDVQAIVSDQAHRLVVIAARLQDFAWRLIVHGEKGEPLTTYPFTSGLDQDSHFLDSVREQLPDFPTGHQAIVFAFDKDKPVPDIQSLQRSHYDVVRFENLAVYPGPRSAVRVSLNGIQVSQADQLRLSDPDSTPPLAAPTESQKQPDGLVTLDGRVVDASGEPMANCWVGMFVQPPSRTTPESRTTPFQPDVRFVTEVMTDDQGRFATTVKKNHYVFDGSFWAITKDGASGTLRMNCTWSHLQRNLTIRVQDSTATVQVLDPQGQPIAGVQVTPEAARKPRSATHQFPTKVQKILTEKTDNNGRVSFRGWSTEGFRGIRVQTDRYGTQYLNERLASQWVENGEALRLTLRPTASVTGRLIGFDSIRHSGLKLRLRSETRGSPVPPLSGTAIVNLDAGGNFEVPQLAAGWLRFASSFDPASEWKIRFPSVPELKAGEDRILANNPELVRAVRVRQRLVKSDTGEACPGVKLQVLWGKAVEGRGSDNARHEMVTDENGWWEARVLPGPINVRINGIPEGYRGTAWFDGRNGYLGVKHVIPASDKVVTLPPERYVPAREMKGRLLLPDGSPAVNWTAYGHPVSWDDVGVGGVNTDKNGEFRWTYPVGYRPRLFEVSNRRWLTEHHFNDSQVHPKVVAENPLVLQIPPLKSQ